MRKRDEVIYIRVDEKGKREFEKQKAESGYSGNADFLKYLLDVNQGKRVEGVTLRQVRNVLEQIAYELKKQGVNINQMAKVANTYPDMISNSTLDLINHYLKGIEDKMLKLMEKLL